MASAFEIRRVDVDTVSWTAITAPIDCTAVDIEQTDGTNNIKVRTDSANAATEKLFKIGTSAAATVGAGVIYTFPRGLKIAISSSIVFWNITATSVADVYGSADE